MKNLKRRLLVLNILSRLAVLAFVGTIILACFYQYKKAEDFRLIRKGIVSGLKDGKKGKLIIWEEGSPMEATAVIGMKVPSRLATDVFSNVVYREFEQGMWRYGFIYEYKNGDRYFSTVPVTRDLLNKLLVLPGGIFYMFMLAVFLLIYVWSNRRKRDLILYNF